MALKRSSLIVAVAVLATGSLFAQYDTFFSGQREAAADFTRRAELAETLVRSRESAGREMDGGFRRALVDALKKESADQLELRLANGNLAIATTALGDVRSDLTYTTFQQPCRIIDTRLPGAGGKITAGELRSFIVAGLNGHEFQGGTLGGCGVPLSASVAMINFVAVAPDGGGNLKGAAYPNGMPGNGSILNYQLLTPALNIANGLLFPLCDLTTASCDKDITLQANGAGTHVVADVLGYSMRFPKERVKSFVVEGVSPPAAYVQIGSTCTNFPDANVTITAPPGVGGVVWARATVDVSVHAGAPTVTDGSVYEVYLTTSPGLCDGFPSSTRGSVDTKAFWDRGRNRGFSVYMLFDTGLHLGPGSSLTLTLNGLSFHEVVVGEFYDRGFIGRARIIAQFIPN